VVTFTLDQALVRTILEHPADYPWRMQDIGLLALRLDDRRECRLHVWDPESCVGDPPVHDHPFDFTSTVIVGELVNTRYVEDPNGIEHRRHRYRPGDDDDRRTDSVRLAASATILSSGDRYRQPATELIHVAQAVLHRGATIDEFIDTTFNFPTRADAYKYAAYDGLQRLRRRTG
jgi:hypothetical protein